MKRTDAGRLRRPLIGAGIVVALVVALVWMRLDQSDLPTMRIATPGGVIEVEVADTPAARSAGLSNRDALKGIEGLLLKWDAPARHPVWMAGMRFPLDLAWVDSDGSVIAVLSNVPTLSHTDPCPLLQLDRRRIAEIDCPQASHRPNH
jgi:uncharacterized membrane protein (UPF0127 family)